MPRVTLKDVAQRAGVSYQTVSKVINSQGQVSPDTEARIWKAVKDLGYRPNVAARSLRTQSTRLIGYGWHQGSPELWFPVMDQFIHGIANAAEKKNYLITVFPGSEPENDEEEIRFYRELFVSSQVDGFVLADTRSDDARIAYLIEQRVPFVAFGRSPSDSDFCWVDINCAQGIQMIIAHLVDQGHMKIAFLTWADKSFTGVDRLNGYRKGMEEAGLPIYPEWILQGVDKTITGVEGIEKLLNLPSKRRPTAFVCVSDQIAVGAMHALAQAGYIVGKDVAVTGFDNIPMSEYFQPSLTTVKQPIEKVCELVVDLLIRQIEKKQICDKGILLEPEIVIRESSRCTNLIQELSVMEKHT